MSDNSLLFEIKNNKLLVVFKGGIFDDFIPSYILEKQLSTIRLYAIENKFNPDDIKIKIEKGSIEITILEGFFILSGIINVLSVDYKQIEENIKLISNKGVNVIKAFLEPVRNNQGTSITIFNNKEIIKKFSTTESSKFLENLPDFKHKENITINGNIFGIKADSKFILKVENQTEEINLVFDENNSFKATEEIRKEFKKDVEIKGIASRSSNGIITLIKVEKYKSLTTPQQGILNINHDKK